MAGKLIICPTPIGNLGDMPQRALDALASADVVCAEDTRVTGKLLAAFGIGKRLERLDEALIGSRAGALVALAEVFPLREAAVCRELTKLHEEVVRDALPAVRDECAAREAAGGIKGEIVIVIDGPSEAEGQAAQESAEDSARVRAAQLKAEGARNKDIAKTLAAEFGLPRNAAYEIALEA